jgi:hypothetical protein
VRDQTDDERGEDDQADREHQDRPQPAAEVVPRSVERVRVEQHRQEQRQDRAGRQRRARHARDQREGQAGEREADRTGDARALRDEVHHAEQREQDDEAREGGIHVGEGLRLARSGNAACSAKIGLSRARS